MPTESEQLKSALFGLLPDNWRMWLVGIAVVVFIVLNPTAAWFLGKKLWDFGAFVVGKVRGIDLPDLPVISVGSDTGIDTPLEAAQSQVAWAVRTGNKEVLEAGVTTLKALQVAKTATAAALLLLCCVGCSGASQSTAPDQYDYSRDHSFGYTPLTETDRDRVYQAEPTLRQQAPELFDE